MLAGWCSKVPPVPLAPLAFGWLVVGAASACMQRPESAASERTPARQSAASERPQASAEVVASERPLAPAWLEAVSERRDERARMVENQLRARGITNARVLGAMGRVPRHRFIRKDDEAAAYGDGPLPIVGGQTISQPYIVAFMSEAAEIAANERCLEIGTGSGYQAAILTELCRETYSIEYLPDVAEFGRRNLESLGYLERGLSVRVGDGYAGWPERAPFDAILVTAAPARVPPPLLEQLAMGGRLVIPVGDHRRQRLEIWTRVAPGGGDAAFVTEERIAVRFVPFLGPGGR